MTDTITLEESRRYAEAGEKQRYADPDMNRKLAALPDAGFKMHPRGIDKIIRLGRADYARHLVSEGGKAELYEYTNVAGSERRTIEALDKNLARFDRHRPQAHEDYRPELSDTDKWIKERRKRR